MAEDEAARARAAAAEARFGNGKPKQRPASARRVHGAANAQLAENTDLPSRYIPPTLPEKAETPATDAQAAAGDVQLATAVETHKLTNREQAELQMALENSMADQDSSHETAKEILGVHLSLIHI